MSEHSLTPARRLLIVVLVLAGVLALVAVAEGVTVDTFLGTAAPL